MLIPRALAVTAVLGTLLGTLAGCSSSSDGAGRASSSASSASSAAAASPTVTVTRPVALTPPAARTLEQRARSGDGGQVRAAFDLTAQQPLDPSFVRDLAALRGFHVVESRFVQLDDVSATVPVEIVDADGATTTWTTTLVLRDGGWRIASTRPGTTS